MENYEEKLKAYMKSHTIRGEHLHFDQSCHSVAEAAQAANAAPEDFVKNICMVDMSGNLIVGIVKGEDRVNTSKVAALLGKERVRTATPSKILEKTGYPCGGTPSFGYPAQFLIDERVMEKEIVYSGGGSEQALVRIHTKELLQANKGQVTSIRK